MTAALTDNLGDRVITDSRPGVLVIVGSFQSIGILRSLAGHRIPTYLIDWDNCIGRFSNCTNRFSTCPPVIAEQKFLEFLRDLAVKQNIKGWLIYPNDDRTVEFLAKHKKELEELYRITVPDWEIARVAIDKRLTHQVAEQAGIPIPRTFYPRGMDELEHLDIEFPAVIKPAIRDNFYDKARKKAIRVDDRAQLVREYLKAESMIESSEIMVQELIPGAAENLYSFGSLYRDGQVLGKVVARRLRQHPAEFGRVTTYAETVDIPELENMATRFLSAMRYQGISEVEFMWDPREGKYKLIEINARFWAWHSIAVAAGVDFPYLLYRDMLGDGVRVNDFEKGVKWFRLMVDTPNSVALTARGKMNISTYLRSWRGKKTFAVWNLKDPLPFLVEILMVPYIMKIRGV
jgi:predicted ATP-grasp superfamily ATP-dependent carboligase